MPLRTLVALKSKVGELDAIRRLAARGGAGPTIIVELLDSITVEGRGRILPALTRAAVHMAAREQPLWIDAHLLSGTNSLAQQPGGLFEFLDSRIETALHERFGLFTPDVAPLVPVVLDSATEGELEAVSFLQEHRRRDVAVRIRGLGTPLLELGERLRHIARRTKAGEGHLHAVIDLGFIETVAPARAERASRLARMLLDQLGPMSTTLLAGSIPAVRNGFVTTRRGRPEVPFWRTVTERIDDTSIHYGDYGVVHPVPSQAGRPGPRFTHPYLYYTVPGHTVALRRQLAKDDGKPIPGAAVEAFTALAEELVARPEFAGRDYSWGDHELSLCRREGTKTAGTVPRWIAIATSHHLEHLSRRTSFDL